jgi:hypothetical protein
MEVKMDKFEVDYSDTANFKGITILYDYLLEGLEYAETNNIKDVRIMSGLDNSKHIIDFEFLKNKQFIENFDWIPPLSKKSKIDGLYYLSELKSLRWGGYKEDFELDLSKFNKLTELSIGYGQKIHGWEKLENLNKLVIQILKTDDLLFLRENNNLEYLRIIRGTISSIKGIENCTKLKTLFLQSCNSLIDVNPIIEKLKNLEQLNFDKSNSKPSLQPPHLKLFNSDK